MKTVIVSKSQPLGKLKISNVPALKVDSREVLVRIKYAGVNYADLLSVQGLYNWNPPPPYILGLESSGEVVELGKEVTKFKVGDRVVVGSKGGNYAEYITKSEDLVLPLPKQFTFKEGAAL
jgi:NADPH2:quinone reductase